MAMKRISRTILRKTFSSLWVGGLGLLFAYPFLWMVVSSFKENSQIFLPLKFWPEFWDLSFFQQLLSSEWFSFGKVLLNSLVISLGQSVGAVLFTSLAGFAFAKHSPTCLIALGKRHCLDQLTQPNRIDKMTKLNQQCAATSHPIVSASRHARFMARTTQRATQYSNNCILNHQQLHWPPLLMGH